MHAVHSGYTVIARLRPDRESQVSALLCAMRADPARLPFADSPTTHFAMGTVVPRQHWGDHELPAQLMLATSFWGPSEQHDTELVRVMGAGLHELFEHCTAYPEGCTDVDLVHFLRDHRHSDTFYSGMQHLTRDDVTRHDELRREIDAFLASTTLPTDPPAARRAIQQYVRSSERFAWAEEPWEPSECARAVLMRRSDLLVASVAAYVVALLLGTIAALITTSTTLRVAVACGWLGVMSVVGGVASLLWGLRVAELEQTYVACRPPNERVRQLAATQCQPVLNEMTIAGPIKPGRVRPLMLRVALWIVARAVLGVTRLRDPMNIPTVATARWIAADQGRRLIFISNFTNDAEPYVRDFIDNRDGARNINLSFGFGDGYPTTRAIFLDGALTNPNAFIDVVHTHQRVTELWYCPYPSLSIDNIKRNRRIREGLFGDKTEDDVRSWLLEL